MKTSPSPSDVPSKQDKPASNLPIKQPSASQPGEKPKPGPKAAKPQKKRAKTLKKRPEKRPFGSIRCRSCNRYGLCDNCNCTPGARYSVMIQSKRITKEQRKQIRRLSFATVKEAEEFRKLIAKQSYRTPDDLCLNFFSGYDPFRVQNHSFPMYESQQRYRMPWAERARDNGYMQEIQMQRASFGNNKKRPFDSDLEFRPPTLMQHASFGNKKRKKEKKPHFDSDLEFQPPGQMQYPSFGNNKKRPIDSDLEFRTLMQHASFGNNKKRPFDSNMEFQPTKRQRMGLSYEQFSPMGASSARMRSLLAQSWQQVARSARPMSRLFPTTMEPAATRSSNYVAAAPSTAAGSLMGSPRSTCDGPHNTGDSAFFSNDYCDKRQIKSLMLDVVSNCLSQRSLPLRSSDYRPLFVTSH